MVGGHPIIDVDDDLRPFVNHLCGVVRPLGYGRHGQQGWCLVIDANPGFGIDHVEVGVDEGWGGTSVEGTYHRRIVLQDVVVDSILSLVEPFLPDDEIPTEDVDP